MNVKIMSLLCSQCVHVAFVYFVQVLYVHIMFKKYQEHVIIIFVRGEKHNKKTCEDENTSF